MGTVRGSAALCGHYVPLSANRAKKSVGSCVPAGKPTSEPARVKLRAVHSDEAYFPQVPAAGAGAGRSAASCPPVTQVPAAGVGGREDAAPNRIVRPDRRKSRRGIVLAVADGFAGEQFGVRAVRMPDLNRMPRRRPVSPVRNSGGVSDDASFLRSVAALCMSPAVKIAFTLLFFLLLFGLAVSCIDLLFGSVIYPAAGSAGPAASPLLL